MKKTLQRTMSLILITTMMFLFSTSAFAVSGSESGCIDGPKEFQCNAFYNKTISMSILRTYSDTEISFSNDNSPKTITISLMSEDGHYYSARGMITIPDGTLPYSADGLLEFINLSSGNIGAIGNFIGYVGDSIINLSLHTIPNTEQIFVYVTIGTLGHDSMYQTFVYGELFEAMNELVDVYVNTKEGVVNEKTDLSTLNESTSAKAASDYNPSYRGIAVGRGTMLNGSTIDLAAATIYSPRRMRTNSSYKSYVKVNGSSGNAYNYVQGTYLIPGALSVWTSSGTCKLSATDNYFDFSEMDPGDESWAVDLPIPYYVGGSFGWLPWSINIGFSTIRTERTKNSGSLLYYNNALWNHNYSKNIDWGSSGAAATQIGYSGAATTKYYQNRSSDYTSYIYGSGSVSYQYSSMFGATQYTGGFTCDTGSVGVSVVIDKTI